MNWKIFGVKYDNRESWAFEQLSYLLFCAEFNNRVGLFRYKNQTGIETEPLKRDGKFYGFQSKYYTTSIAENKDDIIDSIKKAKSKNKHLNVLYLYLNQELSESTSKSKKKPQYQLHIEKAAEAEGVNIEWRVISHFEMQLSLPINKYISDIFFSLEPNEENLLDDISEHNQNILLAIHTEIPFGDKQIKIDRSSVVESISNATQNKRDIIISGDGGSGKTAVFKEFYNSYFKKIPFCVFKAKELNVNHINDIFRFNHNYTLAQFINAYKEEPLKIFAIDSAEKLAEIANTDILHSLIQKLKENGWNIVFTTRQSYLNDLTFYIRENFKLTFEISTISLIGTDELKSLADLCNFLLPSNQKFLDRLRNLFYLNEYVQQYSNINKEGSYKEFIDLLWKKRIQNSSDQKDNLHYEREKCFISVAKQRCDTGRFYINTDTLSQTALFQLRQDEILGHDEAHNGHFITHDLYEEWALNKIVSHSFSNRYTEKSFFDELGSSLPIRRAFRLWLSDNLSEGSGEVENFIHCTFSDTEVTQFWKDEIIVSVLLSDYSATFFKFFEKEIIANDFNYLKRILFLLRIACTDISTTENIDVIKPNGKGWEEAINFIYKYKSECFSKNLKIILPVLSDWCSYNKDGTTTRNAGLLTINIIKKEESEDNFYTSIKEEEEVFKIACKASHEIKGEIKEILENSIYNIQIQDDSLHEELSSFILEKPYYAAELIDSLPLLVIQLCDSLWASEDSEEDIYAFGSNSMESKYNITDKSKFDYFPASANQTPIKWLLWSAFSETLQFIIDFTNRSIDSYRHSDYGKSDVEEIKLYTNNNDAEVIQYLSPAIWCMYRGTGSPVVPSILQSMHMALEKVLLEYSLTENPAEIQSVLIQILTKSKSASLTSVVCSIVLAYPDKFYDVALILFKTIELFHADSFRFRNESQTKSLYSIPRGINNVKNALYVDERLQTCDDKHRSSNLEFMFLNYQFLGVKGFTEEQNTVFIGKLYAIIDQHKSQPFINEKYGILLARMDRRNLVPNVSRHDNNNILVQFNLKELSNHHRKVSREAEVNQHELYKYVFLRGWGDFLVEKNSESKAPKEIEYDENPLLALSETRQLVTELLAGRNALGIVDESAPAFSCAKLMIEHNNLLSEDDKLFCKEIILSTTAKLFDANYNYQVGDGVEAALRAIPVLLNDYPDEAESYITQLVLTLFDETPVTGSKRICDYAVAAIQYSKLWRQRADFAQSVLFGYIKLQPIYKTIFTEVNKKRVWGRVSKSLILEKLDKVTSEFTFLNVSFDISDIESLDINAQGTVLQLIPSDTQDINHLEIYRKLLAILALKLMSEKDYTDDSDNDLNIDLVRTYVFKKFSQFIFCRKMSEIEVYFKPFLDSFSATRETALFIGELIIAEYFLNYYDQFWYVWNILYPKVKELCTNPKNYHLREVLVNYFLAWNTWSTEIREWRSLKKENLTLYYNASKELGNIPEVLYSISKVLNLIGSNFKAQGVDWVSTIVKNNPSLELDDLTSNTLYYLENFLRKFIFNNRKKIREEMRVKNKVVSILEFMIERGSVQGYLLRESIL